MNASFVGLQDDQRHRAMRTIRGNTSQIQVAHEVLGGFLLDPCAPWHTCTGFYLCILLERRFYRVLQQKAGHDREASLRTVAYRAVWGGCCLVAWPPLTHLDSISNHSALAMPCVLDVATCGLTVLI